MGSEWSNIIVGTLVLAAIYGLVAAGFVIVFRATKVLSFAQGGFMLIGALIFYTFINNNLGLYPSMLAALVAMLVIGWVVYRFLFAFMAGAEPFIVAVATLGLSTVAQMIAFMIWGPAELTLPNLVSYTPRVLIGGITYTSADVLAICVTIVTGGLTALAIRYTRLGIRMRATADGAVLAAYTGINVTSVSGLAWGVGAALASVGGILYAVVYGLDPTGMPSVGLAVFPAIILGGLDSFEGAFLGAFIVGIISSVVSVTLGGQWQDPIAYLALLAVLLLRPRGLFGGREIVRI